MNSPSRQSNELPTFGKTIILIVEDDPDHLFLITTALKQCMPGVRAVGVADKSAAMIYVATSWDESRVLPTLIVLDLYLPTVADGLAAVKWFKDYFRSNGHPPVPIIMFSGSGKAEDVKACYDQGVNAYMVKSADFGDWLSYFETLRQYWFQTVSLPKVAR